MEKKKNSQIYQIIGSTQIIISVIILHKYYEYKQHNKTEWRIKNEIQLTEISDDALLKYYN